MSPQSETDYREIARMAYLNATELYEDAQLLLKKGSPRAYALAVASIEELMKAQLSDMVSKGGARPEDLVAEVGRHWKPILTRHESKQRLLIIFLLLRAAKAEGPRKVEEVDRILNETLSADAVNVKGKEHIIDLILGMETRRQDSLYVGTKGDVKALKTPRNQITVAMCEELLKIIEDLLRSVETNLMVSKERYKKEAAKLHEERSAKRASKR